MLLAALSVQLVLEGFFAFLPANRRGVRTGDWEQLVYYGILFAALLGGVLDTSGPDGQTLRKFGLWALIFGGIVMPMGYGRIFRVTARDPSRG